MRAATFVFALLLALAAPAAAQEWTEYQNNQDGFKVVFPGQPKVTESFWTTEQNYILPARVYSAEMGGGRYSITVVDYSVIDRLVGPGYATQDIRGALVYASFKYLQRDAKVTEYLWNWQDLIEGHQLQLTNNADQSRTFVFITMHENKLYVLEATVPKGYPEPGLFQQSLGYVDKDGNGIRYQGIYSNQFHALGIYPVPRLARPAPAVPAGGGR